MLEKDATRSATLAKGLDILDFVAAHSRPLRLREIMEGLGMTKPTAHRLLATLSDYGLIRYNREPATYQLGMRLFELSGRVWKDLDLRGAAASEMARLSELTGETIALALISDHEGSIIDQIGGMDQPATAGSDRTVPLWTTAIGKALVAGIDPSARRDLLDALDPAELARTRFATTERLEAHLDLVNARGYALELEEETTGVVGVAAPILDHRGVTIAAIGLTGPALRLSRERLHELGPTLIEATRRASLRAGGAPRPVSTVPRPSRPLAESVTVAANTRCLIGESPVWDAARRRLYWVDICRPAVYCLDHDSGEVADYRATEMVTALALHPEGLLAATQSGLCILDADTGEVTRRLGDPTEDRRGIRFNDGKCDSQGRFWVGTLALNLQPGAGALYVMDGPESFRRVASGLTLPNGIGWSPDDSAMYLVDTSDRTVYAYDFDATRGDIANRRPFHVFSPQAGSPDGLTVDDDGNLWIALWDGWKIVKVTPDGSIAEEMVMPVPRPTSCTFGGPDGRSLFVTSARIRISEQTLQASPFSGAVFRLSVP